MRTKIVPIGNARGIRLPRRLLETLRFGEEVDLEVRHGCLVLRARERPRVGWESGFLTGCGIVRRVSDMEDGRRVPRRFEVHALEDGTPILAVSPDEMNRGLSWVLGAPVVHDPHAWPTRVPVAVPGATGAAALEEIGRVDGARLSGRFGTLDFPTAGAVAQTLARLFAP